MYIVLNGKKYGRGAAATTVSPDGHRPKISVSFGKI
jgi:hypothetical protein